MTAGHKVTAAQHYHRAALYYGRAQHLIPVKGNAKKMPITLPWWKIMTNLSI